MVAVGIFSIATALIFGLFSLGIKWTLRGNEKSDSYRPLVQAGNRLKRAAAGASVDAVSAFYPSGSPAGEDLALAIPVVSKPDGSVDVETITGEPYYQAYEVYYRSSSDELRQDRFALSPITVPGPMTVSDLQTTVNAGAGRQLISNCSSFVLRNVDDGASTQLAQKLTQVEIHSLSDKGEPVRAKIFLRFIR